MVIGEIVLVDLPEQFVLIIKEPNVRALRGSLLDQVLPLDGCTRLLPREYTLIK